MTSPREAVESPKFQGEDESLAYTFDWSAKGTPTAGTVVIKNAALADKSSTNLSGAASIIGATIVTPLVYALVAGQEYRLECSATIAGLVYESFTRIICEE
jgi:hypothetical protein